MHINRHIAIIDKQNFQRKIVNIFLPIIFSIYVLGAQKNRRNGSFEYPQRMVWLSQLQVRNIIFIWKPKS